MPRIIEIIHGIQLHWGCEICPYISGLMMHVTTEPPDPGLMMHVTTETLDSPWWPPNHTFLPCMQRAVACICVQSTHRLTSHRHIKTVEILGSG